MSKKQQHHQQQDTFYSRNDSQAAPHMQFCRMGQFNSYCQSRKPASLLGNAWNKGSVGKVLSRLIVIGPFMEMNYMNYLVSVEFTFIVFPQVLFLSLNTNRLF